MSNQNWKNWVIGLLGTVIIILLVMFCLVCNKKIFCDESKLLDEKYTYSKIKGLYKYSDSTLKDDDGTVYSVSYQLYLYENGTFIYNFSRNSHYGYMGNYIIVDDTIVLNYLFSTGGGVGIIVTNGSKILKIETNNLLVDEDQPITSVNLKNVTLERATLEEENLFLQANNFSNILSDDPIMNNFS
ncbi:MAG: hypothetical protein ACI4WU_01950 [Bacilli bacterium]